MNRVNPEFVLKDVAGPLGYRRTRDAARILAADEKGARSVRTPGGPQMMLTVTEPGLYKLIMRSDKPEAQPFQHWVTHEVLPRIRKTGAYVRAALVEIVVLPSSRVGSSPEVHP